MSKFTKLFINEVVSELNAMKSIEINVPDKAYVLATDEEEMAQYENMIPSECADLLIQLANIK